jgi:hypothetical protein
LLRREAIAPNLRKRYTYRLLFRFLLAVLHKSGSDLEKTRHLRENDEKSSLHLGIGMIILYLLKVASFGSFGCKWRIFSHIKGSFLHFSILTKWAASYGAVLGSK